MGRFLYKFLGKDLLIEREREARGKKVRIKGQIILQNHGRG